MNADDGATRRILAALESDGDADLRQHGCTVTIFEAKTGHTVDELVRFDDDETADPEAEAALAAIAASPSVVGDRVDEAGWNVLDAVAELVSRYVILPSNQARDAFVLWAAHTHCLDAFDTSPRLSLRSPEPESGKTRAVEVLALLVAKPRLVANMSPAALFRSVDAEMPCLLWDEIDAIFSSSEPENSDLRSLLNSGHRRGVTVTRVVGQGAAMKAVDFKVFAPVAMAGLDKGLPHTLETRCVVIRMKRKRREEQVARFRTTGKVGRDQLEAAERVRNRLATWASARVDELADADPELPDALGDRAQDCWWPLVAIADAAGGNWPERARKAAEALSGAGPSETSVGLAALTDMAQAFASVGRDDIFTEEVLRFFIDQPEAPWARWWAKDVEDGHLRGPGSKLARLFKPFGVHPTKIRIGTKTAQGYHREHFEEPFGRYLTDCSVLKTEQQNSAGQEGCGVEAAAGLTPPLSRDVPLFRSPDGTAGQAAPTAVETDIDRLCHSCSMPTPYTDDFERPWCTECPVRVHT